MKSRKEILREYRDRRKPAGIFQVRNTANGKVLLGSSLNLEGILNGQKFRLTMGSHPNRALQKEWKEFGPDSFVFEIVELVEIKDEPGFDVEDELSLLEEIWLENVQPFGERGYNTDSKIRHA